MIDIENSIDLSSLNSKKFDNISVENVESDKLKKVCDDFESFFLKQIMDVSLKSTNIAGEEVGSDIIKGMYTDTLSTSVSGGMGISNMLYDFLSKNNK